MLLSDDTVSSSQTDLRRRALLMAGCGAMAGLAAPKLRAQTANDHGIEGQIAPEIKLDYWIDRDGKPGDFSVLENRGRWIFLKCFQNWCPGCHASGFPALQQFSAAFHDHPQVAIAGIQTVF